MIRVAIVGTAGRFPELRSKLSSKHMDWMTHMTEDYIRNNLSVPTDRIILVSGGSAWADHTVIKLFNGPARYGGLELHLPTSLDLRIHQFCPTVPGRRLNELHAEFSTSIQANTLVELSLSLYDFRTKIYTYGSFAARNKAIANNCDHLLAFTFDPHHPIASGTAQTWNACQSTVTKIHYDLNLV